MNFGFEAAKVALSLLLVLSTLALAAYGLKRVGRWTKKPDSNSWLEILGQHSVGLKHHLLLVRVRKQLFFLGVSPEGIQLLAPLCDSESSPDTGIERT